LGTEKVHFDDREQARDALKARMNSINWIRLTVNG
jgi:hypothetical protein